MPWTKLDVLHRMALEKLLVQFKIDGLSDGDKADFNRVWHRCRPWPDSVGGLTRIKKRYVIAPMSNGNLSLLTDMAKAGGLPWDCILGAELVHHYKPDPETYLSASQFFDLRPEETMMVAAHQSDLAAAKRAGLRTAYIHRPYEGGSQGSWELPEPGTFDYVVRTVPELATTLSL